MKTQRRIEKIFEATMLAANDFAKKVVVADIATDHGFIAELLSKSDKVEKVIATDISEQSLNKLKKLILLKKLNKIETIIGDGLIPIQNADICVIAGIGGFEIRKMIENQNSNGKNKNKCNIFVLQPTQNYVELREWIFDNEFFVLQDVVIEDADRFYSIITIDISKKQTNEKSIFNLWLGRDSRQNSQDLKHFLMFLKVFLRFFKDISLERASKDKMLLQKYELFNSIEKYLLEL